MPTLQFYLTDNVTPINRLAFPVQIAGVSTPNEIILHLWHMKNETKGYIATDIKLTVMNALNLATGGTNLQGQEIINNMCLAAKSSGTVGTGIVDDAQSYQQIGGSFDNTTKYIRLGDMPNNTARKITFKLEHAFGSATPLGSWVTFIVALRHKTYRSQILVITTPVGEIVYYGDGHYHGVQTPYSA